MIDPRVRAEFEASPAIERSYEDARRGYRAYVVIDTLAGGHASGGIRIRPGVTLEELRSAARVMTWKSRFVGLPSGGAKAGIEGPEDLPREEKARRLAWLADKASDLIDSGVLGVGPDMGTDSGLVGDLLRGRGLLERRRAFPSHFRGSGFYTALSTVEAAAAALVLRGDGLRGKTAAIEGFGAVGSNVARLLSARGARVVAISTSNGALARADGLDIAGLLQSANPLEGDAGARRVAREELLRLEVDLLLPCGPGGTIDLEVAREIRAPLIVPGANSAFTLEAARALHERGRLAVPCFVSNCGGLAAAALRVGGVPEWGIERMLRGAYARRVRRLLEHARLRGEAPLEFTIRALPPLRGRGEAHRRGLLSLARGAIRSRHLPRPFLAPATYLYFARRIGILSEVV